MKIIIIVVPNFFHIYRKIKLQLQNINISGIGILDTATEVV